MRTFARKNSLFYTKFAVKMKTTAVILASGSGKRMGLDRPKQFIVMDGKTVLEHSVDAFHSNELIESIVIVSNPDFVTDVETIVSAHREAGEWQKVEAVIPGGKERSDSSVNALRHIQESLIAKAQSDKADLIAKAQSGDADGEFVLFHDAVRPLVSQRIITDVCQALTTYEAVNVTVPVVDTIVRTATATDAEGHDRLVIADTVDRSTLQSVQTPQGFRLSTIAEAYRRALADPAFRATDDCGVVMRYLPDTPIGIVAGHAHNLKLTFAADIPLFEFLLGASAKS